MQDLLELAFDDPESATQQAEELIAASSDPLELSHAFQTVGIILREAGDLRAALDALRASVAWGARSGDADRVALARSTYGGTLVWAGRTTLGMRHLERANNEAVGADARAKTLMVHAYALAMLGRHEEARAAMSAALNGIREAGDGRWEARTLNNLAHIYMRLGQLRSASASLTRAEALFQHHGSTVELLDVLGNRGEVAMLGGNLADALRWYARATEGWSSAGQPVQAGLVAAHAATFLAAGLVAEAAHLLEKAIGSGRVSAAHGAELQLLLAQAHVAAGRPHAGLEVAQLARRSFRAQGRPWWELRARFVTVTIGHHLGDLGQRREAGAVAHALDAERADEAPFALTLAGRLASGEQRLRLWRAAYRYKFRSHGLVRAAAHCARALEKAECDDRGGALRACSAGLDAIDEHRRLMGSSELRALATTHGRELTEIALRHAAHDPRTLLRWSERTRATALAQPPATSDAATIPATLAALRDNGRRLAEARQEGAPTQDLEKERLRLERAVRTESHTISADSDPQGPASAEEVVAGVGDGCLVELVDVDGVLHVLVVHSGRVRRRVAGTTAEIADLLGPATMLLRRAARGRPANTTDIGRRLQEAILGDAVRLIPDAPLVLAPTARLHGLAWPLLPTLADRPFNVVPSAGQWLRAKEVRRPSPRRTLLVAGPDLASGGAEVPVLARQHPDALLLDGRKATVAEVLAQLDGADLAHLATHGHFRADSPLFSALDLVDGPLTVHDLERLRKAPYRVVLSACESGVLAPVGAEELLGLAAALFSLGTAGLVSSVAEVNDAATADLMVGLHDALARGKDPAHGLLEVRQAAAEDPVAAGTAAAFLALGI